MNNANSQLEGLQVKNVGELVNSNNDLNSKRPNNDNISENPLGDQKVNLTDSPYNSNFGDINLDKVKKYNINYDKDQNTYEKTKMRVIRPCKKKQNSDSSSKQQNIQDDYVNKISKFNGNDDQSKDAVLNVLKHCCFPMEMRQKEKIYKDNSKNTKNDSNLRDSAKKQEQIDDNISKNTDSYKSNERNTKLNDVEKDIAKIKHKAEVVNNRIKFQTNPDHKLDSIPKNMMNDYDGKSYDITATGTKKDSSYKDKTVDDSSLINNASKDYINANNMSLSKPVQSMEKTVSFNEMTTSHEKVFPHSQSFTISGQSKSTVINTNSQNAIIEDIKVSPNRLKEIKNLFSQSNEAFLRKTISHRMANKNEANGQNIGYCQTKDSPRDVQYPSSLIKSSKDELNGICKNDLESVSNPKNTISLKNTKGSLHIPDKFKGRINNSHSGKKPDVVIEEKFSYKDLENSKKYDYEANKNDKIQLTESNEARKPNSNGVLYQPLSTPQKFNKDVRISHRNKKPAEADVYLNTYKELKSEVLDLKNDSLVEGQASTCTNLDTNNIKKMISEHNRQVMSRIRSNSVANKNSGKSKQEESTVRNLMKAPKNDKNKAQPTGKEDPIQNLNKNSNKKESKSSFNMAGIFQMGKSMASVFTKNSNSKKNDDKDRAYKNGNHFSCKCNESPEFNWIKSDSKTHCLRTLRWIRRKYSPLNLEQMLSKKFEDAEYINIDNNTELVVRKDVVRTFSDYKFQESPTNKDELQKQLMTFISLYPEIGYVQGMNFIAATIYFHCSMQLSLGVMIILFEWMELKDIFLPKLPGLGRHFNTIDMLIQIHLKKVYTHLAKFKISVEYFCTDWLMCLGLNMIPLELTGIFIDRLLEYGWNYFYRVIIFYLKKLEPMILKQMDEADLLMTLKSLSSRKNKEIKQVVRWEELQEEALFFRIDDTLIDKLVDKKGLFKPCPLKAGETIKKTKK